MQVETTVYAILQSTLTKKEKADKLCSFLDWDKKEVLEQLEKYSGSNPEDRKYFLNHFWDRARRAAK